MRWLKRYLRPPRGLRITREGRWYIGLTFGVGFGAMNTGNNLLFLALGVLLALIILSGLLSESALKNLQLQRRLPEEVREGKASLIDLSVANGNRLLPAIGLELQEEATAGFTGHPASLFLLAAKEIAHVRVQITPTRRGRLTLSGIKLSTRYPFGIFEKSRVIAMEDSLLVWPGAGQLEASTPEQGRQDAQAEANRAGSGEDLFGIRAWREGDETRRIHWRRSLKVGRFLVVEREALAGRRVRLVLGQGSGESYERAIRNAGTNLEHHLERGDWVSLVSPESEIDFGLGRAHRNRLMVCLANLPRGAQPGDAKA